MPNVIFEGTPAENVDGRRSGVRADTRMSVWASPAVTLGRIDLTLGPLGTSPSFPWEVRVSSPCTVFFAVLAWRIGLTGSWWRKHF